MAECRKCGNSIGYFEYHCSKCINIIAGKKPKKSKKLCNGCYNNWYNQNRKEGCLGYKNAEIIIKKVYTHHNQVIPKPTWKLNCFIQQY